MDTPLAIRKLNIFEVVNHTRRESLIAVTHEDALSFRRRLGVSPPGVIRHWERADQTEFELFHLLAQVFSELAVDIA